MKFYKNLIEMIDGYNLNFYKVIFLMNLFNLSVGQSKLNLAGLPEKLCQFYRISPTNVSFQNLSSMQYLFLIMEGLSFNSKCWFLSKDSFICDPRHSEAGTTTFCEIFTGNLAESFSTLISCFEYQENLNIFKWRFETQEPIISIYSVFVQKQLRNKAEIGVMCEKLIKNLYSKMHFSVENLLYIIKQTFKGALLLKEKMGYFKLTQKMVGINKNGKCKIWVNQNHACNKVQFDCIDEFEMIQSILKLFERTFDDTIATYLEVLRKKMKKMNEFTQIHQEFIFENHLKEVKSIDFSNKIQMFTKDARCKSNSNLRKVSKQSTDIASNSQQNSLLDLSSSSRNLLHVRKSQQTVKTLTSLREYSRLSMQDKIFFKKSSDIKMITNLSEQYEGKIDKSILVGKENSFGDGGRQLQKLKGLGKMCLSMTAEELILEQFKSIYE